MFNYTGFTHLRAGSVEKAWWLVVTLVGVLLIRLRSVGQLNDASTMSDLTHDILGNEAHGTAGGVL